MSDTSLESLIIGFEIDWRSLSGILCYYPPGDQVYLLPEQEFEGLHTFISGDLVDTAAISMEDLEEYKVDWHNIVDLLSDHTALSPRESEVAVLRRCGVARRDIAAKLETSPDVLDIRRQRAKSKLDDAESLVEWGEI